MVIEKSGGYHEHDSLPIPTYDEAISRPSSSQSLGPGYISQDAERQGLLARSGRHEGYRAPTVESARSSLEFDGGIESSGANSRNGSTEELRREIDQMRVIEPEGEENYSLRGSRFSKRIMSLTHTLSSIHLPNNIQQWLPSWDYLREWMPALKPNWIILGRLFALLLVLFLVYLLFLSNLFSVGRDRSGSRGLNAEALRSYMMNHINEANIRDNLRYLTSYDHMAGTRGGKLQAYYVEATFNEHLEEVGMERFDVYLNFPKNETGARRVAIVDPPELAWDALIEEELAYPDDPEKVQVPVFHGHSRSGTVQGPLIYANYGSREDFLHLSNQGISLEGAIALVRYGGSQADRALKVWAAELAGAVGCIIYSDPAEDGFLKGDVWPAGRYMPSDAVQRGSVARTGWVLGDVLTPGYASLPSESRRDSKNNNPGLNEIPSIPLAWRDAQRLLQALKGHGIKLEDSWGKGGVPDTEWWSGDSSSPIVLLKNDQDEVERMPIYNVLGKISGVEQPEKSIIVGNHRDAWCFGAADPSGGTAILLEVVRIFGELRKIGWRPLRTIEFASWWVDLRKFSSPPQIKKFPLFENAYVHCRDGEEYNLIGSTEHVEARMDDIRRDAFAYLNLDVAVVGSDFQAMASPVLNSALFHVLERVVDPVSNQSLRAIFADRERTVKGLDAGSDHAAFQMLAGCSSLDIRFGGPPYPYHSCYDNFDWMEKFGDANFQYHKTIAQIWALLILDLSDRDLLPFDFEVYADAVHGYVEEIVQYSQDKHELDFSALQHAADEMASQAKEFHEWSQSWSNMVYGSNEGFESNSLAIKRMSHNTRMADFETNLLDLDGGLPGREQFKHVIFAPQAWNGYGSATFPGIRDAVDGKDWELAQRQIEKVAGVLSYASKKLNH
ncbi:MAG: hypothetical protein Q9163_006187 [Psora crenata]